MSTQIKSTRAQTNRRGLLIASVSTGIAAVAAVSLAVPAVMGISTAATELIQPSASGPVAMCAEVTPEAVAASQTSVRAEVTGIENGVVTLAVQERFKGEIQNTITVTQGVGAGVDGEPILFADGQSYLLSANSDGMIITCGVSGIADAGLTSVYDAAFG